MSRFSLAFLVASLGLVLPACGGAEKPQTAHLDEVMPMAGVLHVAWTEATPCDFIEAERKDDQHPTFAAAFEVTGDKTSHMDGDAGMNMMYTYRLRCKVSDVLSDYSNEMGANPTVTSP
jgi:hypothetical protein